MKFVTVRDLRTRPAQIWRALSSEKEMILTSNGKPIAILFATSEGMLEKSLIALRRTRAMLAVTSIQARSIELGRDRIKSSAIAREITSVRKRRRSK